MALRTISRNLLRAFTRTQIDATPFPRASEEIQLVHILSDESHLAPLVTNATRAASVGQAAGGAGVFSGALIQAPPSRTVAVYFLANVNNPAANMQMAVNPTLADFTSFLDLTQLTWGDELPQATFQRGTWANSFNVLARMNVANGEVAFTPIYISPGQSFGFAHVTANTTFSAECAITELG